MVVLASELKSALKKFSPIRTETYQVGAHGISATDSWVTCVNHGLLTDLGEFTTNGKRFSQIVNRMSGQIEMVRDGKKLTLTCAKAKVELEVQDSKPFAAPSSGTTSFSIDADDFKPALLVAFASASTSKSSPFGGCVQIRSTPSLSGPSTLHVVGTDGNVLSVASASVESSADVSMLLNTSALQIVCLLDGHLDISYTDSHIQIKSDKTTVFASKPDKVYPQFGKFLALTPTMEFGFSPQSWLDALKTVEPLIEENDLRSVKVQLKDGCVTFSNIGAGSNARDEAEYEQLLPDPIFDPISVSILMNFDYLSGFLAKAGESATLSLTDNTKPIRLESGATQTYFMATKPRGAK